MAALTRNRDRKEDQVRECSEVKVTGLLIDWILGIKKRKNPGAVLQIGLTLLED